MKKLFLLLALLGMVAVGCSKDEVDKGNDNKTEQPNENEGGSEDNIPENIFFGLDKESVTISPDGGSVDVIVFSNYKWKISGTSDWCTPSVKGGDANEDGQKVTFSADVAYDDREATFWFRCADKQIKFVVSQKSSNVIIYYTSSNGEIVQPSNSSAFGATILSNTYKDGVGKIEFSAPITTIGKHAFIWCESLTSVTIPDSVTTIGDGAFGWCVSLTSVTIPDSVTTIGNQAFYICDSLTSVTIPDCVTAIGERAFTICSSLQEFKGKFASEDGRCLIIDGTLNAFAPAGLTEYTIPDSVTTIGNYAFEYCSSLTSVTIGDSVTSIEKGAFYNCTNLQEFKGKLASEDGRCLIIDGTLNAFAPAGLTEYTIPDSVTSIGNHTFSDCSSLTSVTIGDSVTAIGDYAFSDCSSLTSVTIGDSVTTIGDYAFSDCSSLTSVTIGDSVTTIGNQAFSDCSSLTGVTIGDSVTTIGNHAFYWCSSLTSVTIPDSVTTIGVSAFYWCSSLTSVTIPDNVTTIGSSAFENCSSLTSVTIGDSVTEIGMWAFEDCSSLTSVYCKAVTPPVGNSSMFDNNVSGRKIYVPTESVEVYKSAEGWSEYKSSIVGYDF